MCKILRSQFYSERLSQPMVEIKVYVNLYNVSWACPLRQMLESHTWGGNVRSLGSLLYCSTFYSDHSAMLWWWSESRGSLCGLLIHTFINSVILITRVISHLHSMFALLCPQLDTSLKRPHYSPLYCPVYIAMNFVVIKSIRWDLESPPRLWSAWYVYSRSFRSDPVSLSWVRILPCYSQWRINSRIFGLKQPNLWHAGLTIEVMVTL